MEKIMNEAKYNEAVEVFKQAYENPNISLDEKISIGEKFAYCDFVKGSGRIDYTLQLTQLYFKTKRYQDVVDFVLNELQTHFKNNDEWFLYIAGLSPSHALYVIDAYIALHDFQKAKNMAEGLKLNRAEMLRMNADDGLARECDFWYASVIAKYEKIAIIENDTQSISTLFNDPLFNAFSSIESCYYTAIIFKGDNFSEYKNIEKSIKYFTALTDRGIHNDDDEVDSGFIISSFYNLGMIYATEIGYRNKENAILYFKKAKSSGHNITDEKINELTKNIINDSITDNKNSTSKSTQSSSGGCYVATCIYGSYDCPPVWTLRRFRDNTLALNPFGRAFIKAYYAISPTIVKWFGNYTWFHNLFKKPLDKWVEKLNKNGVENTPYQN